MKSLVPYIAVAVLVFAGVFSAFVFNGVFVVKDSEDNAYNNMSMLDRKNIFVSVKNSSTEVLEASMIVSMNPADGTIKTLYIPEDTHVKIVSSDQMFKYTYNIGGIEMMRENVKKTVPLNIDYHLVINSDELYCPDGNYRATLDGIFSTNLWAQENLKAYLEQLLKVASTDLSMFKTEDYVRFIEGFSQKTNEYYTIPGKKQRIGGKTFFVVDTPGVNQLVNQSILN